MDWLEFGFGVLVAGLGVAVGSCGIFLLVYAL